MANDKSTQVTELDLNKLEYRLAELIRVCERLKEENLTLRNQHKALATERAALLEKNDTVRVRVEAMINRLRSMERSP